MTNSHGPFILKVITAGPLAWRSLKARSSGRIIALFERCFYAELGETTVCFGTDGFIPGPLNVATDAPMKTSWQASGLRVGDLVSFGSHHIQLGLRFRFELTSMTQWTPQISDNRGVPLRALQPLRAYYNDHRPSDGLAGHVFDATPSALPQARRPLEELTSWLEQQLGEAGSITPCPPVSELLGMGPGLTPSGDDFIGAMMITLRWLDEHILADALATTVGDLAATATNPISAQHLVAAGEGYGSAALHDVLNAIGENSTHNQSLALKKLTTIGHSSGWDALAGVYTTLKVWQDTQNAKTLAA